MKIMNRIFAAAMTAALALGTLAALPASAGETPAYQMGDVNMDGRVDAFDAVLMLKDYTCTMMGASPILTEEQYALADLDGHTLVRPPIVYSDGIVRAHNSRVTNLEAQIVLTYYVNTKLLNRECSMEDMVNDLINRLPIYPEQYVKSDTLT